MGNIMENVLSRFADKSGDSIMVYSAMSSAAAGAAGYLAACLEASTPEIRRMFSEYLTQNLMLHESLTTLSVKREWYVPYEAPTKQLEASYRQSLDIIEEGRH